MRFAFQLILALLALDVSGAAIGNPGNLARLKGASSGCATPNAPTDVVINETEAAPSHAVSFTPASGMFDGYELWASVDGGSFVISIGNIDPGDEFITDSIGVIGDGHVYIYKVRSTNACGTQSAFSNTVTNDIFVDATDYWNLNETSGNNRVDSIGGVTLTETASIVATAVASGTGVKGNAASFVPATGSYFTGDSVAIAAFPFTLTIWVNFGSVPAMSTVSTIWYDGGDAFQINLNPDGRVYVNDINGSGEIGSVALGALSSWHFICLEIINATTAKLSIDGSALSTFTGSNMAPWQGMFWGFPNPLVPDALFDEASAWNRALSQAEVNSLATGRFK